MTGHSQHSGTGEITDAHFTNLEDLSFGIADEPRESAHLGAGHRAYALELVQNCDRFISENVRKADSGTSSSEICRISLDQAHTSCQNYGSSSVLIGLFRQRRLSLAYLGSSSVLVLRAQTSSSLSIIYRSAPQRHGFSSPYQLPHLPLGPDSASPVPGEIARTPLSPVCYVDVSLEPGDVVVAGSDGLFDNLFDLGIVTLAERRMGSGISPSAFTNSLARALVDSAVRKGADPAYKSPFAKQARLEGHVYVGGRRDDVTAIVTVVGGLI